VTPIRTLSDGTPLLYRHHTNNTIGALSWRIVNSLISPIPDVPRELLVEMYKIMIDRPEAMFIVYDGRLNFSRNIEQE
jgi:hypothetical protein